MRKLVFISALGLNLISTSAFGFFDYAWNYIRQYQLGIEYSASTDLVKMSYEMDATGPTPSYCVPNINDSTKQICSHDIVGGQSSGFGIFLQQAFRRKGNFHFNYDISFGARYLEGAIEEDELSNIAGEGLPLQEASFSLGIAVVKPYIELGYTPYTSFPDLIFRIGPVAQAGFGTMSINEEKKNVAVAVSSGVTGYFEFEAIFWRFGDGALSLYMSNDSAGKDGTPLYPEDVAGMTDFKGEFTRSIGGAAFGGGIKLVLNWP